jgi:hypothetical protein
VRSSIGTDEICLEIYDLVSESKDTDYSLIKLNSLFNKCKTSTMGQIVEILEQLSAFSLLLVAKEYKQMRSSQDIERLQKRLYNGFKAYEDHGIADLIRCGVLSKHDIERTEV